MYQKLEFDGSLRTEIYYLHLIISKYVLIYFSTQRTIKLQFLMGHDLHRNFNYKINEF